MEDDSLRLLDDDTILVCATPDVDASLSILTRPILYQLGFSTQSKSGTSKTLTTITILILVMRPIHPTLTFCPALYPKVTHYQCPPKNLRCTPAPSG